jgi:hypothetical protein
MIATKITIQEISSNTQGLFFCKVAYSRCDVPSEMFYKMYIKNLIDSAVPVPVRSPSPSQG